MIQNFNLEIFEQCDLAEKNLLLLVLNSEKYRKRL